MLKKENDLNQMTNQIISKQDLKKKQEIKNMLDKKRSVAQITTALINKSESLIENLEAKNHGQSIDKPESIINEDIKETLDYL